MKGDLIDDYYTRQPSDITGETPVDSLVKPKRDIVEKLEFGCPFKLGGIGEKDLELAEVLMQEAAEEIKKLRKQNTKMFTALELIARQTVAEHSIAGLMVRTAKAAMVEVV